MFDMGFFKVKLVYVYKYKIVWRIEFFIIVISDNG